VAFPGQDSLDRLSRICGGWLRERLRRCDVTFGALVRDSSTGYPVSVKTTIDIPDQILQEAMRNSGAATKREAVLQALEEYNRARRLARLAARLGTFAHLMTRKELERLRAADERPGRPRRDTR
jgi:Arc/MetJ family transcription regulator